MLYFIHCEDKPDHLNVRIENRTAHVDYIKTFHLLAAGPTLADDEETMNGSVIIIDLPHAAALQDFLTNDPYAKAGLFQNVTTRPWKKVIFQDIT
ncbi:MAG: hypothetical protein COA73_13585 [Candidatus Hydrogenedentota bacterium]|nr:MAG: hypothetical protein COA73_13585 [Candidatus Hydrogenedentota bacterium]